MKTINETFTDKEFEQLKRRKKEQSWHDFILSINNEDDIEYTKERNNDKQSISKEV